MLKQHAAVVCLATAHTAQTSKDATLHEMRMQSPFLCAPTCVDAGRGKTHCSQGRTITHSPCGDAGERRRTVAQHTSPVSQFLHPGSAQLHGAHHAIDCSQQHKNRANTPSQSQSDSHTCLHNQPTKPQRFEHQTAGAPMWAQHELLTTNPCSLFKSSSSQLL